MKLHPTIAAAVKTCFEQEPVFVGGRLCTTEEWRALSWKVRRVVPDWYKELTLRYPLAGAHVGIPNNFGLERFVRKPDSERPLLNILLYTPEEIAASLLNHWPGVAMRKAGYWCIGYDYSATQETIFLNKRLSNPALEMVFHDFGETVPELLNSADKLLPNISDLFKIGEHPEARNHI